METKDFVLLTLLALGGKIQGKTKLQKTVYFLGLLTGLEDDLGYRAHYYGPYSDEVAGALAWLRTIGAVDSSSTSIGRVDGAGFEVRRHDFWLNEGGQRFAQAKARRFPELWDKLQQAVQTFKQAGDLDYVAMSIAAKTFFMLGESKGGATREQLAALAQRFGWDVTPREVEQAFAYLNRLQLTEPVRE